MATRRWAEGYLAGMARAHSRGNVTERAVHGAIAMARRRGIDAAGVREILARHALSWDETTGRICRTEQAQSSSGRRPA